MSDRKARQTLYRAYVGARGHEPKGDEFRKPSREASARQVASGSSSELRVVSWGRTSKDVDLPLKPDDLSSSSSLSQEKEVSSESVAPTESRNVDDNNDDEKEEEEDADDDDEDEEDEVDEVEVNDRVLVVEDEENEDFVETSDQVPREQHGTAVIRAIPDGEAFLQLRIPSEPLLPLAVDAKAEAPLPGDKGAQLEVLGLTIPEAATARAMLLATCPWTRPQKRHHPTFPAPLLLDPAETPASRS